MHMSSSEKMQVLRQAYLSAFENQPLSILDVGSAVIDTQPNGNKLALANPRWSYTGLDIEPGNNVDIAVERPYDWREIPSAGYDVVLCSQVFEHTEFFWITITEIARVLKPHGLLFLIAPSAGVTHRYPYDCWRFYEDGFPALAKWANLALLESNIQRRPVYKRGNQWRDATMVAQRPLRDPQAEREIARRAAFARSALSGEEPPQMDDLSPEPSIIGPAPARNALAQHEDRLLAARPFSYKLRLMNRHFRRLRKVAKTPAALIIDQ
ncbi:MAG: class I SAM-dependent methyltransferase [Beijerinckiaceae bacterium]|nr:class I SAM-dependent methyltransferase [Beijerinckiaceae bacterium]